MRRKTRTRRQGMKLTTESQTGRSAWLNVSWEIIPVFWQNDVLQSTPLLKSLASFHSTRVPWPLLLGLWIRLPHWEGLSVSCSNVFLPSIKWHQSGSDLTWTPFRPDAVVRVPSCSVLISKKSPFSYGRHSISDLTILNTPVQLHLHQSCRATCQLL